jgi:hypothetical protein
MAANLRKSRPNEVAIDLSDASSYGVPDAKRTRGRRSTHERRIRADIHHRPGRRISGAGTRPQGGRRRAHLRRAGIEHREAAMLAECLAFLREGDVLTVTKPDRLARSTAELLSIEADLSKRGIGLVVLSMVGERLDTRNPTSKLMLTILAGGRPGSGRSCWSGSARASPRRRPPASTRGARSASRCGANQATASRVGARGDREASRHRSEFGLPRVGAIVAISVGAGTGTDLASQVTN